MAQAIRISRGESIALDWTMAPTQDIAGWTFKLYVAKQANSSQKVLQATPTVTSAVAGTFGVALASVVTAALLPGSYYWDVWRDDPGQERVLASGAFVVTANARFPA